MTNAPERIGLVPDGLGNWALAHKGEADIAVHYTRADLCQPKAKPLVWDEWDGGMTVAKTPIGKYFLDQNFRLSLPTGPSRRYETEINAKAAAQNHYDSIRKQLFEVTE